MAYIPWWNRIGPITLGERFGLNEISIARNTLSPTKSYTEDRIDMKPGGIVEPGVTNYAKTSGIGTKVKAIDDPNVIKQAENILKKLVEKKHGHKVLDWSEKATHSKLKNLPVKARGNLNDLIIKIADKNGWLDGTQYKNTLVVETFMNDYAKNGYFTGHEKTSDLLKEFRSTHPDRKFQEINKVFNQWKNGEIIVEGYNINNLEKGTLEALDDWSPKMISEVGINKTNQLKYLDELNNQKLSLNQAQAKFRRKFPDARKNAFWHRVDQLYQLKVEGKIPSGKNTFKTHDIVKGDRSDWLKKGLTHNKAGNYNKLLLAADELEAAGKTKQATRLRNAAIKFFSPNTGSLAKVLGQAEHPWFRTHGGTSGQLKIDSLVRGDLNIFKNLNFEAPVQKLINEYTNASPERKIKIKELIKNRQTFINDLTGGMTKNVEFDFKPNEVKVTNLTKPIDTLTIKELNLLKERGLSFEKNILSKGKDLDLITKGGNIIKKQISNEKIIKLLQQIKNTPKGPGRLQLVGYLLTAGVTLKMLNDYGISSAEAAEADTLKERGDETQEASALALPSKWELFSGATATTLGTDVALKGAKLKKLDFAKSIPKELLKSSWRWLPFAWTPAGDMTLHALLSDKPKLKDFEEVFTTMGYDINSDEFKEAWNSVPKKEQKEMLYKWADMTMDKRSTGEKIERTVTSPFTHMMYAFWKPGIEAMQRALKYNPGNKTLAKNLALKALRMGIPMNVIKAVNPVGWTLTGLTSYYQIQKFFEGKGRKTPLTEEEQKDIQKRKEAVPKMLNVFEQTSQMAKDQNISYEEALKLINKPDVPGIEFKEKDELAMGGIASLIK